MEYLTNKISGNTIHISILLYLLTMIVIWILKPNMIFNKKGEAKEFGVGRNDRTILPLWLVAILVSILTYYFVSILLVLL